MGLLSLLILVPVATALVILALPQSRPTFFRLFSLVAVSIQLMILGAGWFRYNPNQTGMQLTEHYPWIEVVLRQGERVHADYLLAVDGMSAPLIALSVVVMFITVVASFKIVNKTKSYFVLLMLLDAAVIGAFSALDLLLFFLFFEFMLLPLYFLVGIWGGPRREYAAVKFFLYTFFGSILILIGIIVIHISFRSPGVADLIHTFNILELQDQSNIIVGSFLDSARAYSWGPLTARMWVFILLFIGFAIKLPSVPFHTWLPDAHVEAPTPVSVVLAALVLKVGAYGIIRFTLPIFPGEAAASSTVLGLFAVISIIYGALNAMASKDFKRLIAYSSVSHMGFVLLGVASFNETGLSGAVFQLVSHGILTTLLFLLAGVLYDRTSDRTISNYSGLSIKMPKYGSIVLVTSMASLGLPAFSGFIAEWLVLTGAFDQTHLPDYVPQWMGFAATFGLLLGAAYFIWTYQRMFLGAFGTTLTTAKDELTDLYSREMVMLVPLVVMTLLLGIFPQTLLQYINTFASAWFNQVSPYLN
ncbi:MAG: NADH-quinone oxidoreductase subunit M [Bacteroidetes bacterium]|nr:NADH-quinone oxidoreductase subunit M [Bacteroidota bacterium]